ncbi:penicillin-binding protein activator [Paracoccus sp. Z118]|uniref:penicillin-binding protein activator n=1 Tax=Paracoccus sp. Z118 TaxID=2851017 RepID=UPI001C2C3769|nr:penicillin-binding protein activator [Paracoccus sp. Z118]MBV0892499.1 penicillin-binding protein activator [Paracoccus sp. Z118]
MTALALRRGLPALSRPLMRVAALVSAAFLAACEPVGTGVARGPQTGPMIDPSQPVPVALLVPGGSGNPELDRIARSIVNSARMAASDAQGARIDLRVYDTGAEAAAAVAGANRAVAEGAQIIVGPLHADSANAVGQAMAGRVNVMAFSNNADIAGGNVFVLGNTFYNTADRLIGYGVQQGKRRVLVVAEDDVSGQAGAAAIEAAIARNRATLAGKAVHPISEQGIDGIVPQVAAIAQQRQADAIFMTANSPAVLPYLTGALADRGVTSDTAQFMGLTRWDVPAARLQLPGVQGGWFAVPDLPRVAEFSQRYQRSYGEAPHELGALGYDAVSAIASLVRAGRSDALTTAGLTSGSGFQGISGVFRLRPDGTNQRGLAVATIRGGQLTIIDPAPRGFGGAGF